MHADASLGSGVLGVQKTSPRRVVGSPGLDEEETGEEADEPDDWCADGHLPSVCLVLP